MAIDADTPAVAADRRLLGIILVSLFIGAQLTPLLPRMALDTAFADWVDRLTDTASWTQLTPIAILSVVVLVSRRGITPRRRVREAATLSMVMLIALVGNALLNENVIKPAFGIPRPNIVTLAETGVLGPELPDAEAFYETGDKERRREVLGDRLTEQTTPQLTDRVRAHWIHETGYSFPSGHTTAAVTFAVLLAAVASFWLSGWRHVATMYLLPLWAIGIAASRTLLEVHTAWDVLGGTVAGFGWGLLAFFAVRYLAGDDASRKPPADESM